jgi:predicted nucleotidyltransferase
MKAPLERALASTVSALDELGLRYAIVGGLAVGAWGVSRSTRDADFYVELPPARHADLERTLRARGFDVPAMAEELTRFGVFRSRSADGVFVDIFDAVGPLGEELLARRREITVFDRTLWVTAPEGLMLLKAFSDRARDFEDLEALAAQERLDVDRDYVRTWALRLDESIGGNEVSERVRRAFTRSPTR